MKCIGDRIKGYEQVTHHTATRRMPLMIRVDGRAFHTYTKKMDKPFDKSFMEAMWGGAINTASQMQGFKAAYIQSDEATFCITDYDSIYSQGWFDYDLSKIISLSAAIMTSEFTNTWFQQQPPHKPVFDSRAFSVPKEDVVNAFLWRAMDWKRNSLQMYAQANFSHKELQGKGCREMNDMLHGIGKNWSDLSQRERNGTFLIKKESGIKTLENVLPTYTSINKAIGHLFKHPKEDNSV